MIFSPAPGAPAASKPLISAHRSGPAGDPLYDNTRAGTERAVALGCQWVELDVIDAADGALVISHDVPSPGASRYSYEDALDVLRGAGAGAHLDLKVTSSDGSVEVAAVQQAIAALGVSRVMVTSAEPLSVAVVRSWALQSGLPGLRVGLSVRGEPEDVENLVCSRANLVVAEHRYARKVMSVWARRRRLPLLVWTVDEVDALEHWLGREDVLMVTTNYPERALGVARGLR